METMPAALRRISRLDNVFRESNCEHLHFTYSRLMESAVQLRRGGICDSRAEALEVAYDAALRSYTDGRWRRTGEVHVDRRNKQITALCIEEGPQVLAGLV